MKRGILLGLLISLLLFALSAYVIVTSGCINPGADEPIPDIERWAAKSSLRAYLKSNVPKKNSPVPVTDANLQDGARLYLNHCASCHGFADAKMSTTAEGLYKRPPIFAKEDWSKDDDNLIYWFINHGVRLTGMPAYNKTLKEDEMWKIVMFIKRMNSLPADTATYWKGAKAQTF
ncbi:MAG: cytochrome c [Cyanobacteria bacterium SZAS LIN-2]|nr:cytochrome c [Cyanobacteria bacterium SZAS LIN-3]MBS1998447.1 cytochrome c [Cyanobacteria bacterium SZAS LIN-2]MBS2006587.1 cytochrome c [Cyanobacteria bacterium SZAS TMP-1]